MKQVFFSRLGSRLLTMTNFSRLLQPKIGERERVKCLLCKREREAVSEGLRVKCEFAKRDRDVN